MEGHFARASRWRRQKQKAYDALSNIVIALEHYICWLQLN